MSGPDQGPEGEGGSVEGRPTLKPPSPGAKPPKGLRRLLLLGLFSPLLVLRWVLRCLPGGQSSSKLVNKFNPPPLWMMRLMTWPLFVLNPPQVSGIEKLLAVLDGETRVLLVGNHAMLGIDQLVLVTLIYIRCGIFCRRLHDKLFFQFPLIREMLHMVGGLPGTTRTCETLMRSGQPIIFYPGGVAESLKPSGVPRYSLEWGDRMGFIHMAVKHGYTLVPFASVGLEDALCVIARLPLDPFLSLIGVSRPGAAFPLLLPFNSLERQYVAFGTPIPTVQLGGNFDDLEKCNELFHTLHDSVSDLIQGCLSVRAGDAQRYVSGRAWTMLRRLLAFKDE